MPTISDTRRVPWINGFGQTRTVIFIGFGVPKPVYPCHPIVGMIWQNALVESHLNYGTFDEESIPIPRVIPAFAGMTRGGSGSDNEGS